MHACMHDRASIYIKAESAVVMYACCSRSFSIARVE